MKNIIFVLIFIFSFFSVNAQEKKSRKEIRAERIEKRKAEVKEILENKEFEFTPSNAQPLGGGTIQLNHYFSTDLKGDTIYSYLPYFGVAYYAEYGSTKSPFDFVLPVKKYELKKDNKGYVIKFWVKNKNDVVNFTYQISELGFATLSVTSTNRQVISFYGTVDSIKEK